jgi:hypothetical protein
MSGKTQPDDIAKKRVVYTIPGMDGVTVRRDAEYRLRDAGALTMDLYYPADSAGKDPRPAVVVVAGYPDVGYQRVLGCKFKELGSSVSWGRLMAASGMVAITYTNRDPVADTHALLGYVRSNAASFGIDETRIGVWASSGSVPLALSVLMGEGRNYLKCAVLCYGYMLDLEGFTGVAEAATKWGFVNPCAGKAVDDLPQETPLFVVRAGRDQTPDLNGTMDRFLAKALISNLPMTFVNHRDAPHAFDLLHDSETSREIVRQVLAFMRCHLLA